MDNLSYLFTTQEHIHENIQFADQKATAFITINSALVGVLFSAKLLMPASAGPVGFYLSLFTFSVLLVAIGLSAIVLDPRGVDLHRRAQNGALAIPEKIGSASLDRFITAFIPQTEDPVHSADLERKVTIDLCELIHTRSQINNVKYRWLKYSIRFSYVGWAMAIALVLMTYELPTSSEKKRPVSSTSVHAGKAVSVQPKK